MPKILLIANTGWYLYNFRLPLARFLRSKGVEVVLASPPDNYVSRLQSEGFRWIEMGMQRRSVNPFTELKAIAELYRIYKSESPDAVHHFTIKPVLYGTIAAKLAGIYSVVNALTGLGHVFVGSTFKAKVLRPIVKHLYRRVLTARRVQVIFQNPDDLQAFQDMRLVIPDRTVLIRGSGVNTQKFAPRPGAPNEQPTPIVLFASRLITDKGVREFVDAARQLKQAGVMATFQLAGGPDIGNPTSISEETLESWRAEGAVDLLGHVDNMPDVMSMASVVVLASYGGEGTPRILLEAAAMGKPIVTTDVPGCREAVNHGVNGFIVPARDSKSLASSIHTLLESAELRDTLGKAGREKMIAEFDEQQVISRTVAVYQRMGILSGPVLSNWVNDVSVRDLTIPA